MWNLYIFQQVSIIMEIAIVMKIQDFILVEGVLRSNPSG